MLTTLDLIVLVVYFVGVAAFGIIAGGRQKSTSDYFLGDRDMPWWAVCFSIVATETSTLTVIGVPAFAFGNSLVFLQLTFGYLLGRIVVAVWFIPKYYRGNLETAYAFLGHRFGDGMRVTSSVTFLITRLLADGVRLFATAIPLKIMAESVGIDVSYFVIILAIGVVTIIYTYVGGIKAVVWMDVVQMFIYVGGALLAIVMLLAVLPPTWWSEAAAAGKTQIFNFEFDAPSFGMWATNTYTVLATVLGGAIFSMASHGTDQLIVQRLLACRNTRDSQKALIGSAVIVMFQFALFLAVGLLLWSFYGGSAIETLGLARADEIFPLYIIEEMPPGISGLLLAGILAAAMSTLSSSLNSLASSSMLDLYERIRGREPDRKKALFTSRMLTLFWGVVFILFANLFQDQTQPVVVLGLAIASVTYGGLLGTFLLGFINRRAHQIDAIIAFLFSIVLMVFVIFGVWFSPETGWIFAFMPSDAMVADLGLRAIGWPWYVVIGTAANLLLGSLLSLRHRAG